MSPHPHIPEWETLTRAQRKVLADLELFSDDGRRAVVSSRKLAQTTNLSRPTVLAALDRLNELELIRTVTPRTPQTSEHTLLFSGSVRPDDGQNRPSTRRSGTKAAATAGGAR